MPNDDSHIDMPGEYTPKQRLEMERWANLNGMTLEEFLKSDIHQQFHEYRKKLKDRPDSYTQKGA